MRIRDCGGITLKNGKYELRPGRELLPTSRSETSWLRTSPYVAPPDTGPTVHGTSGEWSKEQPNRFLSGYSNGRRQAFKSLTFAKSYCRSNDDCGGVTLQDGRYELRAGHQLLFSSYGESSWLKISPNKPV